MIEEKAGKFSEEIMTIMEEADKIWGEINQLVKIAVVTRIKGEELMNPSPGFARESEYASINHVVDMICNQMITLIDELNTPIVEAAKIIQQLPYGDDINEMGSQYPQS